MTSSGAGITALIHASPCSSKAPVMTSKSRGPAARSPARVPASKQFIVCSCHGLDGSRCTRPDRPTVDGTVRHQFTVWRTQDPESACSSGSDGHLQASGRPTCGICQRRSPTAELLSALLDRHPRCRRPTARSSHSSSRSGLRTWRPGGAGPLFVPELPLNGGPGHFQDSADPQCG